MTKTLSLALPTHNMKDHLRELLNSIRKNPLYDRIEELIVVDDGSTDGTSEEVKKWGSQYDDQNKLRLVTLSKNQGRFLARLAAAEACKSSHLFFLDTRIRIPDDFCHWTFEFLKENNAIMAALKIDPEQSLFSLYWLRSHQRLFSRTWESEVGGYLLTRENYHDHVKGTTAILCPTAEFLKACEPFRGRTLFSDDTALLYEMTLTTPIYRDARLYIWWEPRQSLTVFLKHIFRDRGLAFADYHVFQRWSVFSYAFFAGVVGLIFLLGLIVVQPVWGLGLLGAGIFSVGLSAAFFAKNLKEFFQLAPLQVAIVSTYGVGALVATIKLAPGRLRRGDK